MSYARYLGEEGEISAIYRPADQEPDLTIGSAAGRHLSDEEWTELCLRHDNYFIESPKPSADKGKGP